MVEYTNFLEDLTYRLRDPVKAKSFLKVALEEYENDGDTQALMLGLRCIAEAQGGIAKLAEKTNLNRQNLYKIFSCKITPRFDTLLLIIRGLGYRLQIA